MSPYGLSAEERARLAAMHAEPGSDVDAQVAELRQRIAELEDLLKRAFPLVAIAPAEFEGANTGNLAWEWLSDARDVLAGRPSEMKGEQ